MWSSDRGINNLRNEIVNAMHKQTSSMMGWLEIVQEKLAIYAVDVSFHFSKKRVIEIQVLAESAKKLQEVAGSKAAELIQRRNTVPEDESEFGVGQEAGAGQGTSSHAEEQSLSQVARKRTLPFSSSVFSDRKYRYF